MRRITFCLLGCLLAATASAQTPTLFGTLTNFDVFNDTGQETHGFEIQLDGITSNDVAITFGAPYQARYGTPTKTDFPGGVYVRYESPYNAGSKSFTGTTPVPPAITPTAGHSCWTGGAPGYLTSGCEHFGLMVTKSPTSTAYRWLIEDPATPGTLARFGTDVSIPSPAWSVVAAVNGGVVVEAAIPAPKAPPAQFGNAVWVKTFETESPDKVELHHLVTDDPAIPQNAAQLETEWELSQSNPKKPERAVLRHGKPLGKGNHSVVRRYEFYKFTGTYDPFTHEARCGGGECKTPLPSEIGDYIGAQMAAAHLDVAAAAIATVTGVLNAASGDAGVASGSWVSIYGTNLSTITRPWEKADFVGDSLPTALGGVTVTMNGKPAAVYYVSPTQLNVQAPTDDAAGPVPVQVSTGTSTAVGSAMLQKYGPGFFAFSGKYVAAVHADGVYVAPAGFFGAALVSRPAQPGEIVQIYATGFGPTTPDVPAGVIVNTPAPLADPAMLQVRIGGVTASVRYAGLVAPGEYQFNVVIPALADGDQPIVAEIGGLSTQSGLSIAVKN